MDRNAGMEIYKKMKEQKEEIRLLQEKINFMRKTEHIADPFLPSESLLVRKIKRSVKRIIKKGVFWLVKPYWEQQNIYNQAVADALQKMADISERMSDDMNDFMMNSKMLDQDAKDRISSLQNSSEQLKSGCPKVIQFVSSLNYGDAVGNDIMAIKKALEEEGYVTAVFAANIHEKIPFDMAFHISALPVLTEKDVLIYHLASEDPLAETIKGLPCKKILRYHNITPPEFFRRYDKKAYIHTLTGLKQVKELKDYIDCGMTVSEFNKKDLTDMGYQCPINVVPILIPFDDYEREADQEVIKKYQDGWKNIIFVGRIAPNKKVEDILLAYKEYKDRYHARTRLLLVGSYQEEDGYYKMLTKLIRKHRIQDVEFTGHISFEAMLAYYRTAHLFVCMSEHEGFCVPLVEAMYFGVPIVAFRSTAVPETLGSAGMLINDKTPAYAAKAIHQMMNRKGGQDTYETGRSRQLEKLQYVEIKRQMLFCLDKYIERNSIILRNLEAKS